MLAIPNNIAVPYSYDSIYSQHAKELCSLYERELEVI